jgi:small-conductance mechanosensitive channel
MILSLLFSSLCIGALAGCLYGFLFVFSKQKALSREQSTISNLITLGSTLLRFALLVFFLIYLLRWDFLGSILTLASFLAAFWLIIIRKGLEHHEGHNPN